MNCATCGAEIQKANQRYCHECGASLPDQSRLPVAKVHGPSSRQLVVRPRGHEPKPAPHELLAGVLPSTLQNRLIVGAAAVVIAIFAIKLLVDAVASFILTAVPVLVLIVLAYIGFKYFQSRQSA
jgi:hypothetical protein